MAAVPARCMPTRADRAKDVSRQVADLKASGFAVELQRCSTMRGPAHAIAGVARNSGAEMIVVGGTTHGAFAGALAGSTPQALLHAAPCPVLVAPAGEAIATQQAHGADRAIAA